MPTAVEWIALEAAGNGRGDDALYPARLGEEQQALVLSQAGRTEDSVVP